MIESEVRTETYLRSDIINVLSALDATTDDIAAMVPGPEMALYRAGYAAALRAAARSFDVEIDTARHDGHSGRLIDVTPRRRALNGRMGT
jgi:hypothetical protein